MTAKGRKLAAIVETWPSDLRARSRQGAAARIVALLTEAFELLPFLGARGYHAGKVTWFLRQTLAVAREQRPRSRRSTARRR